MKLGVDVQVFAPDIALAPWGWAQRQRRVEPDEVQPELANGRLRLFPSGFPRRLAYSRELGKALRGAASEFDLVHIHNLWQYPQLAAYKAALDAGVPYVVSPHGGLDPYLRRRGRLRKHISTVTWQGEMLEKAARIHVTTATEQALIADIAPHVPRTIVPCGLDVGEFTDPPSGAEFRDRYIGGYDGRLVLFLGRITEKKGVDVLVRAFAGARREADCRLAVVGPDDTGSVPALRRLAGEVGVGDDVVFVDALYGQERLGALGAADVWALSSHTENFGIAVVEAMAAGCPVVISPAVNIAPDIEAADAGVVAPAEPEPFAAALLSVLAADERRRAYGEAGPTFAKRYDWRTVAPQIREMYSDVLDSSGARRGRAE